MVILKTKLCFVKIEKNITWIQTKVYTSLVRIIIWQKKKSTRVNNIIDMMENDIPTAKILFLYNIIV